MSRGRLGLVLAGAFTIPACLVTFEDYPRIDATGGKGNNGGAASQTGGRATGEGGADVGGKSGDTGGSADGGEPAEVGGARPTGGATGSGGGSNSGGKSSTGGSATSGGTSPTGGGSPTTGGAMPITGGSSSTGGSPPTTGGGGSCTPSGSCSTGDQMSCIDGVLTPGLCDPCVLLGCGLGCCNSVGFFAAQNYPTYSERPDLIVDFLASASSATLDVSFDGPDQFAAITFALASATVIDPFYFHIYASVSGTNAYLTVSLENGPAGCAYNVDSAGYLFLSPFTCWESFTGGSPVQQINVRVESDYAYPATLYVYDGGTGSISW